MSFSHTKNIDIGYKKEFTFNSDNFTAKALIKQLLEKYDIKDLTIEEADVESVVRRIYEGDINLT